MTYRTVMCQLEDQFIFHYDQLNLVEEMATLARCDTSEVTELDFYKRMLAFQNLVFQTSIFEALVIKAARRREDNFHFVVVQYANVPFDKVGNIVSDYAYVLRPNGNVELLVVTKEVGNE